MYDKNKKQHSSVKKEDRNPTKMYVVRKAIDNLDASGLVMELNPLQGIQPLNIREDDVHSIVHDQNEAQKIATEVYETYIKEVQALEEKKGKVGHELRKTIDLLEKKRKDHLDMAKQNPKNASQYKNDIAKIATQIDDLMSKMERIEKSKKLDVDKEEDKKDKKKDKLEERINPIDKISLDVPLFIRLLEYAREDAKTDMDLHTVAQKVIILSQSGMTLSMNDYSSLVANK